MKYNMRLFYLLVAFTTLQLVHAQTKFLDSLKLAYPDQKALYLKHATTLRYSIVNDSLKLQVDNYSDKLILSENASLFSEKNVYYSGLIKINSLSGKTIVYNGSKEKIFKNLETEDKDAVEPGIFYDDLKMKRIQFPNVVKGARMILDYQSEYKEPNMFGPINFSAEYPVIESACTVILPSNIEIDYKLIGIDEKDLEFKKTAGTKETVYSWKCKSQKEMDYFSDGPNPKKYTPQLVILVRQYPLSSQVKKIKPGTKGLYEWCYSFSSKARQNESNLLRPLVDSLTANAKSEKQKSEKIFYWVQDNIRYLAFEDGYGGYIPRHAEDIYQKRYGDCKDMANLLTTMHTMAGIKSYLVWIGTRDIPYSLEQVPLPCAFNHMISVANIGSEWIYLDATGKYTNHGFPTDMIQAKEALISINKDSSLTLVVPEVDLSRNVNRHDLDLALSDNVLKGKGKRTITGLPKANFLVSYHYVQSSDRNTFWSNNLRYGNNKCESSNYLVETPDYTSPEFIVSFDVSMPDYVLKVNDETFVNLNLKKDFFDGKIEDLTRKVSIQLEMKHSTEQHYSLKIPEGYTVSYLPEKVTYQHPLFNFEVWYEKKSNSIVYHKKININTMEIKPENFNDWNEMVRKLNKAYKESITLKKIK
jgi:hypothetical protein